MNQLTHSAVTQNNTFPVPVYPSYSNGKEKDHESGFHYYGARYYWSEVLTGWLSVDPMVDKYPSISPYAFCAWNPVKLVDPDGRAMGNFYDCDGNLVGSDGKEDGKIFLLRQTKNSFDSKPGPNGEQARVNHISPEELQSTIAFIAGNNNNTNAFTEECIAYTNSIEIESFSIMKAMYNACITNEFYPRNEIGGVVNREGNIDRVAVGTTDNVGVTVYTNMDKCWFHCHLPDLKRHGGYNESILDKHDRYHAPSYSDTQQFQSNPSLKGYVFDTQNERTYIIQGGEIQGYIKTSTFQ